MAGRFCFLISSRCYPEYLSFSFVMCRLIFGSRAMLSLPSRRQLRPTLWVCLRIPTCVQSMPRGWQLCPRISSLHDGSEGRELKLCFWRISKKNSKINKKNRVLLNPPKKLCLACVFFDLNSFCACSGEFLQSMCSLLESSFSYCFGFSEFVQSPEILVQWWRLVLPYPPLKGMIWEQSLIVKVVNGNVSNQLCEPSLTKHGPIT